MSAKRTNTRRATCTIAARSAGSSTRSIRLAKKAMWSWSRAPCEDRYEKHSGPRPSALATADAPAARSLLFVQAEPADEEEENGERPKKRREAPAEEKPAGESAPAEQQPQQQEPQQQEPEAAPKEQPEPEAAPRAEEPTAKPEPAPEQEAAPEPAPRAEEPAKSEQPAAEEEPAPRAAPQSDEAPAEGNAPAEEPAAEQPAEPEAKQPDADRPANGQPEVNQSGESQSGGAASDGETPEEDAPAAQQDGGEAPGATPEDAPRPEPAPQVAPEAGAPEPEARPQPPASNDNAAPEAAPAQPGSEQQPATDQPEGGQTEGGQAEGGQSEGGTAQPEGAAPVLDSQKEQPQDGAAPAESAAGGQPAGEASGQTPEQPAAGGQAGEQPAGQPAEQPAAQPVEAGPPPADDSAAQQEARPVELQPVTAEEGRRIERRPEDRRQERPEGAEVVREIGDRIVIRIDNRVIVESNDRPRIARGAREVYYEELPRGRIREVVVRENGTQVITIRDRYGDVVRRSRIAPDGRETVLVYVEADYYDRVRDWRDPGRDLPPMRLTIPAEEYILDAGQVEDADAYYTFLDQPPVERVERLYSIDEVKRSARIRDKTRRVDLDTITFEFGSASIAESEVARLEGVAKAMERLLEENPAETFLIEGHTDAVGSDIANLALSDRRAEAVADALTNVFAIPPENLATQGYGEQYLKVNTEEPERENRRVAIRRITPLVAPVASAQ